MSVPAIVLVAITVAAPICAQAVSEYCALEVRVRNSSGVPVETVVMVEGENGRRTVKESVGGKANFCDVGIDKFKIVAGAPCGRVTISGLTAAPPTTRVVNVIYDQCFDEVPPLGNACTLLLRVSKDGGQPLPGAALWVRGKTYRESDKYGRMFLPIRFGDTIHGVVRRDGYMDDTVDLTCPSDKLRFEHEVKLSPLARP